MTVIKEAKLKEFQTVNYDKLRKIGSVSGWQKILYNFITIRLATSILEKMVGYINIQLPKVVPEGTDPEEVKSTIKTALLDYIDSVF